MKRKHAWDVPENVTIEKIQEIRERITQWAIRVVLMMILLIVGIILIALGDDTKRIGKYVRVNECLNKCISERITVRVKFSLSFRKCINFNISV